LTNVTTVLVTGGAGFIGSHVTAELLRRGHAVRVLDNFSTGKRENLAAVGGEVELIEGGVRSYERTHARRWSGRPGPGPGGHMPIAPNPLNVRLTGAVGRAFA